MQIAMAGHVVEGQDAMLTTWCVVCGVVWCGVCVCVVVCVCVCVVCVCVLSGV